MYLLWTERPVRLPREEETHAWMEAHRPWERFGLDLVYDNAPGDWIHYSEVFHATWERSREQGTGFLNVESDVIPTLDAFRAVLNCPQPICVVPYESYADPDAKIRAARGGPKNWGAVIEERCRGGWDAHNARGGEEWAVSADLGFVRFGPVACQKVLPEESKLRLNHGLLHWSIFQQFRSKDPRDERGRVHLHWPGLLQSHLNFDEGDLAHWGPGDYATLLRTHRDYMTPGVLEIMRRHFGGSL